MVRYGQGARTPQPGTEAWSDRAAILAGAKEFAESGAKLVRLEFPKTGVQVYDNTAVIYTTYLIETESEGRRMTKSGRGTEIFVGAVTTW